MIAPSPTYRMASRLAEVAGVDLEAVLREMQIQGLSNNAISSRLYSRYGIEVSHTTVWKWLRQLSEPAESDPLGQTA